MTGRRRKPGRMGPVIEGYRAWLAERGYTPGTIVGMLAMAGGLGRWMDARDIVLGDLDRALLVCGTARGAGGTLSPVAGDRPRAGRGDGRALCEAGALVPESASDRPG